MLYALLAAHSYVSPLKLYTTNIPKLGYIVAAISSSTVAAAAVTAAAAAATVSAAAAAACTHVID